MSTFEIGNIPEEEQDKYKVKLSGKDALVAGKDYLIKQHIKFGSIIDTEIALYIGKFKELSGNNVRFEGVSFHDDNRGEYNYYEKEPEGGRRRKSRKSRKITRRR